MLQNAIIRFPLYRKEECDDKKVDLNFLFPLFVLCLFCSLALEFWFVCCVSLSANRKWWMQWGREREKRLLRLNAGSDLGSRLRLQSHPFAPESRWFLQMFREIHLQGGSFIEKKKVVWGCFVRFLFFYWASGAEVPTTWCHFVL